MVLNEDHHSIRQLPARGGSTANVEAQRLGRSLAEAGYAVCNAVTAA